MKQELRFGLDFGRLAILKKKIGPIMSNFLGCFFHVFKVKKKKKIENIVHSVRTKKLHTMKLEKLKFRLYWPQFSDFSQ